MKKLLPIFLFIGLMHGLKAQEIRSAYDQLVYVNEQWKNQPDVDPGLRKQPATSMTEQQLVRFHL